MNSLFTEILVLIILIVLNAFFAASEIALITLNDNKIKVMAEAGNKKAKLLQNLLSEPSRFLATIQIGITLAGFLASAFAAGSFAGRLAHFLYTAGIPLSEKILETLSVIGITLVLSYFTLVIGELVPKRIAMQKAEPISMIAAVPLSILSKVTSPFVKLLTFSTNGIVRLFGVDPNADRERVTEEEIRMMVDVGEENGTIQETEKTMINNIFEFDNKVVSDIMTHRTNIVGIPSDASFKEILALINQDKYSRFPVYEDNLDHIIGILNVKDLIYFMEFGDQASFSIKDMLRAPYFVIGSKKNDDLFKEMQIKKVHMAIVNDSYGGTDGLVTIEDLLEEIVGNIFDEYDEPEEDEIESIGNDVYLMKGIISLYQVKDYLQLELPTDEYDTLSGFVIGQIGHIPKSDESSIIEYNGVVFEVIEVDDKRITKVKVSLAVPVEYNTSHVG